MRQFDDGRVGDEIMSEEVQRTQTRKSSHNSRHILVSEFGLDTAAISLVVLARVQLVEVRFHLSQGTRRTPGEAEELDGGEPLGHGTYEAALEHAAARPARLRCEDLGHCCPASPSQQQQAAECLQLPFKIIGVEAKKSLG